MSARENNLQTKVFGGAMIGLQFAGIKAQLGPMLNGVIGYDIYLPAQAAAFPGVEQFLDRYAARARRKASTRSATCSRPMPMPRCR